MPRIIETAPTDGKFVILEEEETGEYDAARWSPEAGGWVGENGEPIKIKPAYWRPIQGENHLQQGLDFSFFLRTAAAQRATASNVIASRSVAASPVTVAAVGAQTTPAETKRASQARWRFVASLIASCVVVVASTALYFRAEVADEAAIRKAAEAQAAELQQERNHSAALASELATVRRDFDTNVALSSKTGDEVAHLRNVAETQAAELQQERDHRAALSSELATVRRDFDTNVALSSKAVDEVAHLRNAEEAKAAELQLERDHSAALASELATVRRDFDAMAALSRKAGDEVAHLRSAAEAQADELQQERDHTAAPQSRAPAAAAPVAAPPGKKISRRRLATLMDRAKRLVAVGDFYSARLLLERAADAQEPTAALMLARTYDPDMLQTPNARNTIPDPARARVWYQRAAQLGSADAQRRLSELQN